MNWPLFIVQWIHVLLGVLWFGYALSMYFLISPTLMELPEQQGRITNSSLARVGGRVFPIVGLLVLALGILRGTVFGPINSLEDLFGTTYGWTWLVAFVGTVTLFYTGPATSARSSRASRTLTTTRPLSRACAASRGSTWACSSSSSRA